MRVFQSGSHSFFISQLFVYWGRSRWIILLLSLKVYSSFRSITWKWYAVITIAAYNPSNIFACAIGPNMSCGQIFPDQNWGISGNIPQFSKPCALQKYLKDIKHASLHLGRKNVRIFVLGHYLFLMAYTTAFLFCYALGKLFATWNR